MDLRINHIFNEEIKGDTSFKERDSGLSLLFGGTKYSKQCMRKTWEDGIKHGIEVGLRKASLEGQIIELNNNTTNERHIEFIERLNNLYNEYNCGIKYHPEVGMVILAL